MTTIMDEITELHIKQDLKDLEKKIDAILKRLDELEEDECACGGTCQCSTTKNEAAKDGN